MYSSIFLWITIIFLANVEVTMLSNDINQLSIPIANHDNYFHYNDHYVNDNIKSSEEVNSNEYEESDYSTNVVIRLCRHKIYLPANLFYLDTCAACYKYMNPLQFYSGNKLNVTHTLARGSEDGRLYNILALALTPNITVLADRRDPENPIYDTFADIRSKEKWVQCCKAAEECCDKIGFSRYKLSRLDLTTEQTVDEHGVDCPATWDGWQCWDNTEAGSIVHASCPHYIYFLTEPPACSASKAEKRCLRNGTWFQRPKYTSFGVSHHEWTDFRDCASSTVSLQQRRAYVHIASYSLSIITIIPALFIFFSYKQLRVQRIILHQNLLLSLLLNGALVVTFKVVVILKELNYNYSMIESNTIGCRILLLLTKYSRMTNYLWMFSEGFYLHKLISTAFAEQKSLRVFYIIGWVFPILPCVSYATYRIIKADFRCWVEPQNLWEWFLNGPSLLSLLLNMIFLINIIRVLVTKLRATHAQEPSQYRKAVRATLVLLPLFGLHFLVTIYRPPSSGACLWTELYFYANDVLDGLQGFLVALIFCYFNGEVSSLLGRSCRRARESGLLKYCCQLNNGRRGNEPRASHTTCTSTTYTTTTGDSTIVSKTVMSTHVYTSVPVSVAEDRIIGNEMGRVMEGVTNGPKNIDNRTTTSSATPTAPTATNTITKMNYGPAVDEHKSLLVDDAANNYEELAVTLNIEGDSANGKRCKDDTFCTAMTESSNIKGMTAVDSVVELRHNTVETRKLVTQENYEC